MNPALLQKKRWSSESALHALILLAAAVLRLALVNAQSLSMDEVKDLRTARGGFTEILNAEDRFPPLYHSLLSVWLRLCGWDETGHVFSVLCGVLTVWVAGRLGRCVGGRTTGLAAAAVFAVSPFTIWYATESRVYGLYFLLAAAALWQYWLAVWEDRRGGWIGFAAASVLGIYTHYYFGLLTALAGVVFLARRPAWPQLRAGLLAFAAIGVLSLPALWCLEQDLDQPWGFARTSNFTLAGLGYTFFSFFSGYSLGPSLRELHTISAREAAARAAIWLPMLAVPVAVLLVQGVWALKGRRRRMVIVWLATFGLAPTLIVGLVSRFATFGYNVRHVLWSCIVLLIVMAVGMAKGRPRGLATLATALVFVSFLAALYHRTYSDAYRNEDSRAVAAYLQADQDGPAAVFVLSGYMIAPLEYYLPASWPVFPLPDATPDGLALEKAIALIQKQVSRSGKFWLAYSRAFHGDPQGDLFQGLSETFDLQLAAKFAGYRLYRATLRDAKSRRPLPENNPSRRR